MRLAPVPGLLLLSWLALPPVGRADVQADGPVDEGGIEATEEACEDGECPEPRKYRIMVLPSSGYNPDDGFGAGAFGDVRRICHPDDPLDGRPCVWTMDWVARMWIKPEPRGWELSGNLAWFPRPDGTTEARFLLGTTGAAWDWWFGAGNDTPRDLTHAGGDDPVSDYWHRFALYQVRSHGRLFRSLGNHAWLLGGIGVQGNHVTVREDTLLEQQAAEGGLSGLDGSVYGSLDLGIRIDTRNQRHDPTAGGMITAVAQTNIGKIDGFGAFGRLFFDVRGFLGPPRGEVVLAGKLAVQAAVGDVPFHELGVMAGFETQPRTLTGVTGLRGQDRGRIRGPLTLLTQVELRFRPPGIQLLPRFDIRLIPALFVDAGRCDEWGVTPTSPELLTGMGGGIRAVFNEMTTVRLDFGTGPEQVLTDDGLDTEWGFKVYATGHHAF